MDTKRIHYYLTRATGYSVGTKLGTIKIKQSKHANNKYSYKSISKT